MFKKFLFSILILISFAAQAQVKTKLYVGGPLATNVYRGPLGSDSGLYAGAGCGDPNILIPPQNLHEYYQVYRGAFIFKDTCNDNVWTSNPDETWTKLANGDAIIDITGLIQAGQYVYITGTGTTGDPYIINAEDSNAFHTTYQISDTCFLIRRPDGTEDTVCISGGDTGAGACANVSVSINGGSAIYPDGNCNINLTDTALNWTNLFSAAFGAAGGVAGSTTNYGQITGRQTGWVAETGVQFVMSEPFTMQRLFVRTSTAQPAGGDLVITLRVEGSNTALTVTIPAGSAAGTFSDITHTVSVTAGEIIDWQVANGSGSTSATITSIGATAIGQ